MEDRWLDVDEARTTRGLRLVITVGVPGPWGEGAKGLFHVKGIPFARVAQAPGRANEALVAWTGESNAPQAVYDDEPPRNRWNDLVLLAERLAPEPRLVPEEAGLRATLFGLLHELCGEDGFGWNRRQLLFAPVMDLPEEHPARASATAMATRYGWSEQAAARAPARCAEIAGLLAERLAAQQARGSEYLIGDSLTALDIYWAAFAALVDPLPEDVCPMSPAMRAAYGMKNEVIEAAVTPELLAHRDLVYQRHLELPIDLGPDAET